MPAHFELPATGSRRPRRSGSQALCEQRTHSHLNVKSVKRHMQGADQSSKRKKLHNLSIKTLANGSLSVERNNTQISCFGNIVLSV